MTPLTRWHNATRVNISGPKKRIWSLEAAFLSLNGAKNNPKIVTKITAVRPRGGGGARTSPPPLNTPMI